MATQRELDLALIVATFQWMNEAFAQHPGAIRDNLLKATEAFASLVQSYEEEIECLKHALPADKHTQMSSLPAHVDSAEE